MMAAVFLALLQISQQAPRIESLGAGSGPLVSPDGEWVVFRRSVITEHLGYPHKPEFTHEVWARHLKSREEKRLHAHARIAEWIDRNTVVFEDGTTAALKGAPGRFLPLPKDAHAVNAAWTDGRAAYISLYSTARPGTLTIVEAGGKLTPIELAHALFSERPGTLAWSPDGKRLAFHQVFLRPELNPIRRIGVIDAETGVVKFVGEGAWRGNPGLEFGEGKGAGAGMWDAKGERFVFVTGRAGGEGEVHVASADGGEVLQVTEDSDCKWSAVLEPAGRRVAYCAAEYKNGFRTLSEGRVRVLDLLTGMEVAVKPLTPGIPQRVAWLPDGSGIVWDWDVAGDVNLYRSKLEPLDPLPAGTTIKFVPPLGRVERIRKALQSTNQEIVAWAAEQCRKPADRELIPDLRTALASLKDQGRIAETALLLAVAALDAREAAPEVVVRAGWGGWNRELAINLIGRWRLGEESGRLLAITEEEPTREVNVIAAGALAWLSHLKGWKLLDIHVDSPKKHIRAAVVRSIEGLHDPMAVDLLIRLVEDPDAGAAAERALALITGQTFEQKAADWTAWWRLQKWRLPVVPHPNPALRKLDGM